MATLSWDQIVERAKQHNKSVICELEKRGCNRYFETKCDLCGYVLKTALKHISCCKGCYINKKTSNTEEFIIKAKKIHGNKYNYDLVKYLLNKSKVKIFCNICNKIFLQSPITHLRGAGCFICAINATKSNIEDFILKARKIHDNKYNYDLVKYVNSRTKVKILCNDCNNTFLINPNNHLSGVGCSVCANLNKKSNKEEFVKKSKKIYGDKFNYDLVEYVDCKIGVKILCNDCNNIFLRPPNDHLRNKGCLQCKKFTTQQFVLKAIEVHGDKYNYDLSDYKSMKSKVKILCNICNKIFLQSPDSHLRCNGCRCQSESKGENRVAKYLTENNISFIPQKTFDTLRDKNLLRIDFYLEDQKLLIEYDGEFHYKELIGSTQIIKQKNLEDCQHRDKVKNEWAKANNIPLLRIPYWDFDRIPELIEAFILEHTSPKEIKQLALEI